MTVQTTTKWALRYYQGTDAPSGMTQQQDLANDVDKSLPQFGTLSARSGITHHAGLFYLATDTLQLFISDGAAWVEIPYGAPAVPIGTIIDYSGSGDPADTRFLLADGRALARAGQYAPLFAIAGTAFGIGDGSTTFNIPDLRGRASIGPDNMGTAQGAAGRLPNTNRAIGQSHGVEQVILTGPESGVNGSGMTDAVANHAHASSVDGYNPIVTAGAGGVHRYNLAAGFDSIDAWLSTGNTSAAGEHTHNLVARGASVGHNNVQPGQIVNKLLRVK